MPATKPPGGLGLPIAVAIAVGALTALAWGPLGLPLRGVAGDAPVAGAWRAFYALCLPGLFVGFTLLHAARGRGARADRASYAVLLLFLVLMAVGRAQWRWLLGGFFVAVLLGKVSLAVATIARSVDAAATRTGEPAGLRRHLFGIALLAYAALVPYVAIAVSTGGDEPIYLLNVESLFADADLDVANNVARGDADAFYWGPSPSAGMWERSFFGFPALLLPGYALARTLAPHAPLAGRIGAMLTIALCAALAASQAYALYRELGVSPRAALWAWLAVALTPPLLVHAGHVYPEIPAALLLVIGVRGLVRLRGRPWPAALAVAAAAGALIVLKDRYAALALGLLIWALVEVAPRGPRRALAGVGLLVAGAAWILWIDPLPALFPNLGSLPPRPTAMLAARALVGVVADQEFGLLYYAPVWVFALAGIAVLWRRARRVCVGLLALSGFYLVVVIRYRWMRWFGGWTPAPRFVVVLVPMLGVFLAAAFDRAGGRLRPALNTLCLAWSTAVALALALVPLWRYDDADGRARLLAALETAIGLDLARFLPSLVAPTAWTWVVLGAGAVAGVLVLRAGRPTSSGPRAETGGPLLLPPATAVALVGGVAVLWLASAAIVPTLGVEAEAMRRTGGTAFQSPDYAFGGWALDADGSATEPIVTWPGWTEIRVVAAAYTTTGRAPRLTLLLDGRPVAARPLRGVTGQWVRGEYAARVPTGFGRAQLRLELTGFLDDPVRGGFQHAYVDGIRIRPFAAAAAAADCVSDPVRYCPDAPVTRAQLAELLVRVKHGERVPAVIASTRFGDVGGDRPEARAIELLAATDVMPGCDPTRFCPDAVVTRDLLAVVLLRAVDGSGLTPPPPTGRFRDVPASDPLAAWIDLLGARQLTCGCGGGRYCPRGEVTWAHLAKFVARAFPGSYPPAPCRETWW
jgi:hypothetical protein